MFIWLITFYNKKTSRATFFGRTASFFPAVIATAPFFVDKIRGWIRTPNSCASSVTFPHQKTPKEFNASWVFQ